MFFLQVVGLNTNLQFLIDLGSHPEFQAGNVHTDFIPQHQEDLFPTRELSNTALCHSAMALLYMQRKMSAEDSLLSNGKNCGGGGWAGGSG
jgi:3-methylcrotonyl-CoA carboxylase alpha subunit